MNRDLYKPLPIATPPPRTWVDQQERLRAHDVYSQGGGNWANPINPENRFGVEKTFWPWYFGPNEVEYEIDKLWNDNAEEMLEDEEEEWLDHQAEQLDRTDFLVPEFQKKDAERMRNDPYYIWLGEGQGKQLVQAEYDFLEDFLETYSFGWFFAYGMHAFVWVYKKMTKQRFEFKSAMVLKLEKLKRFQRARHMAWSFGIFGAAYNPFKDWAIATFTGHENLAAAAIGGGMTGLLLGGLGPWSRLLFQWKNPLKARLGGVLSAPASTAVIMMMLDTFLDDRPTGVLGPDLSSPYDDFQNKLEQREHLMQEYMDQVELQNFDTRVQEEEWDDKEAYDFDDEEGYADYDDYYENPGNYFANKSRSKTEWLEDDLELDESEAVMIHKPENWMDPEEEEDAEVEDYIPIDDQDPAELLYIGDEADNKRPWQMQLYGEDEYDDAIETYDEALDRNHLSELQRSGPHMWRDWTRDVVTKDVDMEDESDEELNRKYKLLEEADVLAQWGIHNPLINPDEIHRLRKFHHHPEYRDLDIDLLREGIVAADMFEVARESPQLAKLTEQLMNMDDEKLDMKHETAAAFLKYLGDMPMTVTQQIDAMLAGQILEHFEYTDRQIEGLFGLPADFAVPPTWAAAAEAKSVEEEIEPARPLTKKERRARQIDKILQPLRFKTNINMPRAPEDPDITRSIVPPSKTETIRMEARLVEAMDVLRAKAKEAAPFYEEVRQFEIKQMQKSWLAPWRDVSPKKVHTDAGDPEQMAFRRPPTGESFFGSLRLKIRTWIQEKRQKYGLPTFRKDLDSMQVQVVPPLSPPMPDLPPQLPPPPSGEGVPTAAPPPQFKSDQFVR